SNLGYLHLNHDGPGKAEKYFEQACEVVEKLVADYPNAPSYQHTLGGNLSNLAGALDALGKSEQARPLLERAIKCQQEALRLSPGHRSYRHFLWIHVNTLAKVLGHLPVPPEELDKAHRRSMDLARALAADCPDVPEYQAAAGEALTSWADGLRKRGRGEQARSLLEEAIGYQKRALLLNPKHPKYREKVGDNHNLLSIVLASLKK